MTKKPLAILLMLIAQSIILTAQDPTTFNPNQQKKNLKRWIWYQPSAIVVLSNGDTLMGQPIHFNMEEFLLFPSDGLPIGLEGQLKVIHHSDIECIWLTKGGRITAAQTSGIIIGIAAGTGLGLAIGGPVGGLIGGNILGVTGGFTGKALHKKASNEEIWLDPGSLDYRSDLMKLRTWSVFEDSPLLTNRLQELPAHSAAVRRAFPQKHFRISLGVNTGIRKFVEQSMRKVLKSSELPEWNESYGGKIGFEYLDFSWRVNPHWIAGWGMMTAVESLYSFDYYPY